MADEGRGAAISVLIGAGAGAIGVGAAAAARGLARRRARRDPEAEPRLADVYPESAAAATALLAAGLTVATAESCTGGLLGAAITALPGSSRYMLGGVIAYANEVKIDLLQVPAELIEAHGAVSESVALAMAAGVRRLLHAGIGLGITGVAGPGAEGSEKPPGLIWVAVAGPAGRRQAVRLEDDHGREANRGAAVRAALGLCTEAAQQAMRGRGRAAGG
ncbi:MAG TPA: nicotinamide-nucleotide amidohydrolase family protein [Candidatus Dormibacteraeota bacterium]